MNATAKCNHWPTMLAAILASLLCAAGGIYLLAWGCVHAREEGWGEGFVVFYIGMGLYFLGKACFVGPILMLTARHAHAEH